MTCSFSGFNGLVRRSLDILDGAAFSCYLFLAEKSFGEPLATFWKSITITLFTKKRIERMIAILVILLTHWSDGVLADPLSAAEEKPVSSEAHLGPVNNTTATARGTPPKPMTSASASTVFLGNISIPYLDFSSENVSISLPPDENAGLSNERIQDIYAFGTKLGKALARRTDKYPYVPASADYVQTSDNSSNVVVDARTPWRFIADPNFFHTYVAREFGNQWYVRVEGNLVRAQPALLGLAQQRDVVLRRVGLTGGILPEIMRLPREVQLNIERKTTRAFSVFYFVSPDYFRELLVDTNNELVDAWNKAVARSRTESEYARENLGTHEVQSLFSIFDLEIATIYWRRAYPANTSLVNSGPVTKKRLPRDFDSIYNDPQKNGFGSAADLGYLREMLLITCLDRDWSSALTRTQTRDTYGYRFGQILEGMERETAAALSQLMQTTMHSHFRFVDSYGDGLEAFLHDMWPSMEREVLLPFSSAFQLAAANGYYRILFALELKISGEYSKEGWSLQRLIDDVQYPEIEQGQGEQDSSSEQSSEGDEDHDQYDQEQEDQGQQGNEEDERRWERLVGRLGTTTLEDH